MDPHCLLNQFPHRIELRSHDRRRRGPDAVRQARLHHLHAGPGDDPPLSRRLPFPQLPPLKRRAGTRSLADIKTPKGKRLCVTLKTFSE